MMHTQIGLGHPSATGRTKIVTTLERVFLGLVLNAVTHTLQSFIPRLTRLSRR